MEIKRPVMEVDMADVKSAVRTTKGMLDDLEASKYTNHTAYAAVENYLIGRKDVLMELGLWVED